MKLDKFVLAQNMAFLGSIASESNLAKLLAFCLATKERNLAKQHAPHKVDVFFCGSPGPGLSTQLKSLCTKYGFGYRKENF